MPVTIETIEPPAGEIRERESATLDLAAGVTFEQYSEVLKRIHAEFIAIAVERGWDSPSKLIRRISLEFPERRTSKVTPAQISEDLTEDMFLPEGWAQFTAKTQAQYAERLVLFRKRILRYVTDGYFSVDIASRVLLAGGLPPYDQPEGFRYTTGTGPRLEFTSLNENQREVTEEVGRKFTEFFAANEWAIQAGYTLPMVSKRRDPAPIPEDETAPLL